MNAAMQLRSLSGGYGRLTVFRDVTCEVSHGEIVGILGPNGGGKTALLNTIAGALPSHGGSILLEGQDVTGLPAYRRARAGLVLVPQGRHVFGDLSVRDNLVLTKTAQKFRGGLEPFEKRLARVYDVFPRLHERADQASGSLSGGEQQMLAIGRALLLEPVALMLDEPTQGLAPNILRLLAGRLGSLRGRFAMLIVEQNKVFLEQVADRILPFAGGLNSEL